MTYMARLNLLEETRFEKLPVTIYENQEIASRKVAQRIANLIIEKQGLCIFPCEVKMRWILRLAAVILFF